MNNENNTFNRLVNVIKRLKAHGADFLVVGGVACNFHGLVRTTKDIDFLIPKDVKNTEKILAALSELPWQLARELDAEQITKKPFTIIGDLPRVDLLTVAGSVKFETAIKSAEVLVLDDNTHFPYADIDTLIKMKNTGRPKDKLDVEQLEKIKQMTKL